MSKQIRAKAKDMNGAVAGTAQPNPELNTVDELAENAGLRVEAGKPINTFAELKSRDQKRLEFPSEQK